jgi:hypothetical protein
MQKISHGPEARNDKPGATSDEAGINDGGIQMNRKPYSLMSISLLVVPSVLFLALAVTSTYSHLKVSESLRGLDTQITRLLEAQTAHRELADNQAESRLLEAVAAQAFSQYVEAQCGRLKKIDERLTLLTESVSRLSAQMASGSVSVASKGPSARLPPLPAH